MSIHVYFNPLDKACKNLIGAVRQGENIQLNVFLLKNSAESSLCKLPHYIFHTPNAEECMTPTNPAYLHFNRDGEQAEVFPMQITSFGWSISLSVPETGLYYYTFYIEGIGYISCNDMQVGYISDTPKGFQLTVFSTDYHTPEWFKGGVMYQIFPDRFARNGAMPDITGRVQREDWGGTPSYKPNEKGKVLNNDFFGGNFKGIQEKLPYLKSLGITTVYLNPIFEAASNHRYDTSDYMKIDPFLGTEEDFQSLVNAAKTQGIRIILDGVFNHTGDDSVYFNKYGRYPSVGAYQSKQSPYYSWYSFQRFPDKYESWWGIDILPEVNESSEEYQNFIFGKDGVLKKWLSFGIGGYRLDVADELPDFFLKKLRNSVKESDKDAIIIGEVWEDASNKVAYDKRREYLHGGELDSVMNYPLKDAIIGYIQNGNAANLLRCIRTLIDHYPKETVDCLMNVLGTHDTARILTVLGGIYCQNKDEMAQKTAYLSNSAKKAAIQKLKMAALIQFTMPGVPCIYYGDENAQEGHIDPFCRLCYDWKNQNTNLIAFYQQLGKIRERYHDVFKDGEFQEILCEDGLFCYKRYTENKSVYIFANNSSKSYIFNMPKEYINLLTNETGNNEWIIKPYSYGIFIEA